MLFRSPFPVTLFYDYVNNLIGKEIGKETIKSIVESLEMRIVSETEDKIDILVPAYRVDVQRPCDVVEDILRIYGYNNVEIPTQLRSSLVLPENEDRKHQLENIVGEQLVGCGFNEILNNSMSKTSYYKGLNVYTEETTVKVVNPLSADLGVMRQTLLFGGLESIMRNVNRKSPNLRFFEFGNCYHYNPDKKDEDCPINAYAEETHLALWLTGKRVSGSWIHPDESTSFYELRAYVQNILRRVGMPQGMLVMEKTDNNVFSNGVVLKNRGGKSFVEMGIVSTALLKQNDIDVPVFYADLHWDNIVKAVRKSVVSFKEISKYPSVSRDLALLLDNEIEFEQVERVAFQSEKKLLKKVELFDVYQGDKLPVGKKSYAVNFVLQDEQATLNDKKIDAIMSKLIANLKKQLGAELR